MPSFSDRLKMDSTEKVSTGDWQDTPQAAKEAPMTLRYAESKDGKSRESKTLCAQACTIMRSETVITFDRWDALEWAAVATRVSEVPRCTHAEWRNGDVAQETEAFKTAKVRAGISFLRNIDGILLPPTSRNNLEYCPLHQQGRM